MVICGLANRTRKPKAVADLNPPSIQYTGQERMKNTYTNKNSLTASDSLTRVLMFQNLSSLPEKSPPLQDLLTSSARMKLEKSFERDQQLYTSKSIVANGTGRSDILYSLTPNDHSFISLEKSKQSLEKQYTAMHSSLYHILNPSLRLHWAQYEAQELMFCRNFEDKLPTGLHSAFVEMFINQQRADMPKPGTVDQKRFNQRRVYSVFSNLQQLLSEKTDFLKSIQEYCNNSQNDVAALKKENQNIAEMDKEINQNFIKIESYFAELNNTLDSLKKASERSNVEKETYILNHGVKPIIDKINKNHAEIRNSRDSRTKVLDSMDHRVQELAKDSAAAAAAAAAV